MKKNTILALLSCAWFSMQAYSLTKNVDGTISRILTDAEFYGGCMIYLQTPQSLDSQGLACRDNYVTFDCRDDAGMPGGRAQAELNLQTAQLAMAMNSDVRVMVRDDVTLNGRCYASRIMVFAPAN